MGHGADASLTHWHRDPPHIYSFSGTIGEHHTPEKRPLHTTPAATQKLNALLKHPLILPLYLPALLLSVAQGLLLPVLPLYAQGFDAPYFWIGLVLSGDGLGMLLGDLPAGVVLRRMSQRQGMLVGLGMICAASLAMFWAQSIPEAFLYRVIVGLGSALYNVARHTYIADVITIATRGRSVALLGGTFRVGRMIGPLAGGSLAAAAGLRVPFLVYAAICALAAGLIWVFNRGDPGVVERQAAPVSLRSIRLAFKDQARRIFAPGLGQLLMQMVRAGPGVVIPLYGAEVLGLDVQQIGWVFGVSSAVDMLLFYPTGIIMDRLGRKWSMVPSALIMAVGLALIPFTHSLLGLMVAAMINGFGNGLGSGVMLTLGADLAPPASRGEFLGMWSVIGDTGVTSGPVLIGAVADTLALQPAAWAIASAGLAAGLVFAFFVPETLKRE